MQRPMLYLGPRIAAPPCLSFPTPYTPALPSWLLHSSTASHRSVRGTSPCPLVRPPGSLSETSSTFRHVSCSFGIAQRLDSWSSGYAHLKFTEWSKQYGPVISCKLFGSTMVVLNDADSVMELMDKRSGSSSDRAPSYINSEVGWECKHDDQNVLIRHIPSSSAPTTTRCSSARPEASSCARSITRPSLSDACLIISLCRMRGFSAEHPA